MKVSVVFILLVLFISCNQSQPPKDVPIEGDNLQSENIVNQPTKNNTNSNQTGAIISNKALMGINKSLIGTYLGTIGEKEFKLCIEKAFAENLEGYTVAGNKKMFVKGKMVNKATEPSGGGGVLTIYRLMLSEPKNTKLNGEFIINLFISKDSVTGEGNWISYNKKTESYIKIKEGINH